MLERLQNAKKYKSFFTNFMVKTFARSCQYTCNNFKAYQTEERLQLQSQTTDGAIHKLVKFVLSKLSIISFKDMSRVIVVIDYHPTQFKRQSIAEEFR